MDISQKISDYRDHGHVQELEDKVQNFKIRFQNIKRQLRETNKKYLIKESQDPKVAVFFKKFTINNILNKLFHFVEGDIFVNIRLPGE